MDTNLGAILRIFNNSHKLNIMKFEMFCKILHDVPEGRIRFIQYGPI